MSTITFKHFTINIFCYEVFRNSVNPYFFKSVGLNKVTSGLILKCFCFDDINKIYYDLRKIYRDKGLIEYFNWKKYKYTIQLNIKKQYIDKIKELKIILRIQKIL